MITQEYQHKIPQVRHAFHQDGIVLLQQFLKEGKQLRKALKSFASKREYHPLRHSWNIIDHGPQELLEPVQRYLRKLTDEEFEVTIHLFKPGDYSLLHDQTKAEHGTVAFLEASDGWDEEKGGWLGIEQERVALPNGSLLIVAMHKHRWFIKRISTREKKQKILVVFRERKRRI